MSDDLQAELERLREENRRLREAVAAGADAPGAVAPIERRILDASALAQAAARATLYEFRPLTGEVVRNDAIAVVVGYAPAEIEGSCGGWKALIHPEDRARFDAAVRHSLATAEDFAVEYRLRHKDGHEIWVADRARMLRGADGRVERFIGMVADITEQRRRLEAVHSSEALYRATFDNAAVGIAQLSLEGRWLRINNTVCRIAGYTREELLATTFAKITHPEDLDRDWELARRLLAGEISSYSMEKRYVRPGGELIWVYLTVGLHRDDEGRPQSFISVIEDISDRKAAERELSVAREQLQRHSDELERTVAERTAQLRETITELESFSYTVSHDLRSPLRALFAYSDVLLEDHAESLNAEGRAILSRIAVAARRMDALTRDLLDYTRLTSQRVALEPVAIDDVFAQVLEFAPALREQAAFELRAPLAPVLGHPTLIRQILANLIDNAIKFTRPGLRPQVVIRTEVREDPGQSGPFPPSVTGRQVRLWVEDNGIGIAPQYHERVFGIFERIHDDRPREGTGIGLAIVAKAATRMNGRYGVESAPGEGSRFWIELAEAAEAPPTVPGSWRATLAP